MTSEPPHLLLQETDGVIQLVAAKGVRADQLGAVPRLVHGRLPDRTHLVNDDRYAERHRLPGRFRPGQSGADDVNAGHGIP
jgi:hypothetical protein